MDFAKQEFKFSKRIQGGSIREQLESVWRQTGVKPPELADLVELPKSLMHLWKIFSILSDQRSTDFGKPNPLQVPDILACAAVYNIELEDWEFELIIAFDKLKMNQIHSEIKAEQDKGKK